jgi:hypothetical protein
MVEDNIQGDPQARAVKCIDHALDLSDTPPIKSSR